MIDPIQEYIVTDPTLADYAIVSYKAVKDSGVTNSGEWLLWTEDLFQEPAEVEAVGRTMYNNIDIAFTDLDRMTDYGELDAPDEIHILYQAFNTDKPKVIRFWKDNRLYLNGVDYTLAPDGSPVPRKY